MDRLKDIVEQAIADYGFRQVVMWSPQEVIARWHLSEVEARTLRETLLPELERLPVPVEPDDRPTQSARLARLLQQQADGE